MATGLKSGYSGCRDPERSHHLKPKVIGAHAPPEVSSRFDPSKQATAETPYLIAVSSIPRLR